MGRPRKIQETQEIKEENINIEEKAETKKYIVCTKKGYALNVRNLKDNSISRVIENGTQIEVVKIENEKAILNDNEYVLFDLIKEEV